MGDRRRRGPLSHPSLRFRNSALTTYGANKEADRGRLYQCFEVPVNATELQFSLSGGADAANLYVALWEGERLFRKMTARNDNAPFRVRWNVEALRGKFVTLEIVDNKTGPWGFLTAEGFAFRPEVSRNSCLEEEETRATGNIPGRICFVERETEMLLTDIIERGARDYPEQVALIFGTIRPLSARWRSR